MFTKSSDQNTANTVALEAVRNALQALHGFNVSFDRNLTIKVARWPANKDFDITVEGRYHQRWRRKSFYVLAGIKLKKNDSGYLADHIYILRSGKFKRSDCDLDTTHNTIQGKLREHSNGWNWVVTEFPLNEWRPRATN